VASPPRTPDVLYDADPAPTVGVLDGQLALDGTGGDTETELPWAGAAEGPAVELDHRSGWDEDGDLDGLPLSYQTGEAVEANTADQDGELTDGPSSTAGHGDAGAGAAATAGSNAKGAKDRAIDPSRIAEFVGSVSIAGAALAAVGFLLPWASVVIGSTGSGYFDRWGLAGPGHVIVVAGILTVLALSVVRNPIPTWIRTGIGGLAVGSLLLGLTWPYLLGPLDAAPGVLIDAIGAIALIGSGVLALATDRHAEVEKPV
jgi:hypothetical protein